MARGDASRRFGDGSDLFVPEPGCRAQSCLCQRLRALLSPGIPAEVRSYWCSLAFPLQERSSSRQLCVFSPVWLCSGTYGGGFMLCRRRWGCSFSASLVSRPPAERKAISSLKTDPSSPLQAPLSLRTRTRSEDRAGAISLRAG